MTNMFCLILLFLIRIVGWGGVESILGPLGMSATEWPTVPAPGDYDDGELGGMNICRGNQSTPLCPPQIPLARARLEPGPPWWELVLLAVLTRT
jgi:hypothetical protein